MNILLPCVCHYNLVGCEDRFAKIAAYLGESVDGLSKREVAEKGIAAIERLAKDLNIPSGFEELGAKHEDIQTLAENAMKDVTAATNPRLEEVMEIIRQAM